MPGHKLQDGLICDARELGARLRSVRVERCGEDGLPALGARLGVPAETWRRYERGATVPAEVLLAFVELTGASIDWLLSGVGPRYVNGSARSAARPRMSESTP